jgi:hypothetical protein
MRQKTGGKKKCIKAKEGGGGWIGFQSIFPKGTQRRGKTRKRSNVLSLGPAPFFAILSIKKWMLKKY